MRNVGVTAGRDLGWWQLRQALYEVCWVYASEHGKKVFSEDMEKYDFVRYYPAEALSEPIFRTWHFF